MPRISTRTAALALVAGGLIHGLGGVVGQAVRASTDVSDELFRYPWPSDVFVATSILWAASFVLILAGLAGLRASGLAGRGARTGLVVGMAGVVVIIAAELASIGVRDQATDDGGAALVGALFGLATVLMGVGLTVAGRAAVRAWEGLASRALLACGVWALLLLGLVATPVMPLSVAVFGLLIATLGAGLLVAAPEPGRARSSIALR
jgi:hypothetical protein